LGAFVMGAEGLNVYFIGPWWWLGECGERLSSSVQTLFFYRLLSRSYFSGFIGSYWIFL